MNLLALMLATVFVWQSAEGDRLGAHRTLIEDDQPVAIQETITILVEEDGFTVPSPALTLHVERSPDGRVRLDVRDLITYVDGQAVAVIDARNDEVFLRIPHEGRPDLLLRDLFADIPSLWLQLAIGTTGDVALLETLHPSLAGLSISDADPGDQDPPVWRARSGDARVSVTGVLPGRMDLELRAGKWVEPGARIRWEVVSRSASPRGTSFEPGDRIKVDHLGMLAPRVAGPLEVGSIAPPLVLPQLDGGRFDLTDQAGRILVLDFWASWCAPCRAALPQLEDFSRRIGDLEFPVEVLTVNTSEQASDLESLRVKVNQSRSAIGFELPVLLDLDGGAARRWGISALPTTIVVGPTGRIAYIHRGAGPEYVNRLTEEVRRLIPTD